MTGPGQALVEIAFAGVNLMDIGVRQGMAWTDTPNPKVLGVEGVGRVVAVGDGVEGIAPGQRVAWVYAPGSYAERIAIPAASLVPVPDAIAARVRDAQQEGDVASDLDAGAISEFLIANIAGIRLAGRGGANRAALTGLADIALKVLR